MSWVRAGLLLHRDPGFARLGSRHPWAIVCRAFSAYEGLLAKDMMRGASGGSMIWRWLGFALVFFRPET